MGRSEAARGPELNSTTVVDTGFDQGAQCRQAWFARAELPDLQFCLNQGLDGSDWCKCSVRLHPSEHARSYVEHSAGETLASFGNAVRYPGKSEQMVQRQLDRFPLAFALGVGRRPLQYPVLGRFSDRSGGVK